MLKGEYTRSELGVKRGNIQWKVKVNNETLLFVNEGMNNKPESNYIYSNHLDRENNVMVYVNLMVSSNVIIKELSANLQTKIKEKIKTATDLDVKEVNITVKKVAPKEEQQEA